MVTLWHTFTSFWLVKQSSHVPLVLLVTDDFVIVILSIGDSLYAEY